MKARKKQRVWVLTKGSELYDEVVYRTKKEACRYWSAYEKHFTFPKIKIHRATLEIEGLEWRWGKLWR